MQAAGGNGFVKRQLEIRVPNGGAKDACDEVEINITVTATQTGETTMMADMMSMITPSAPAAAPKKKAKKKATKKKAAPKKKAAKKKAAPKKKAAKKKATKKKAKKK